MVEHLGMTLNDAAWLLPAGLLAREIIERGKEWLECGDWRKALANTIPMIAAGLIALAIVLTTPQLQPTFASWVQVWASITALHVLRKYFDRAGGG